MGSIIKESLVQQNKGYVRDFDDFENNLNKWELKVGSEPVIENGFLKLQDSGIANLQTTVLSSSFTIKDLIMEYDGYCSTSGLVGQVPHILAVARYLPDNSCISTNMRGGAFNDLYFYVNPSFLGQKPLGINFEYKKKYRFKIRLYKDYGDFFISFSKDTLSDFAILLMIARAVPIEISFL